LVYKNLSKNGFNWEAFTNFIHGANIVDILEEISTADFIFTEMQMLKLFGQI
jgi:DNA polymerase-3 subunit delta'